MIHHYPEDWLPEGFSYPEDFLKFAEEHDPDLLEPWDLIHVPGVIDYWRERLAKQHPLGSEWVHFAKLGHEPTIACFAPRGLYPDTKVVVLDGEDLKSIGIEKEFDSFADWLSWANKAR